MTTTWIDGELLAFDLETTGVDKFEDVPVSFALVWFENRQIIRTRAELVDPGRDIPPGAAAVHGISTERARGEGIAMADAIDEVTTSLLDASRRGVPVVGYNLQYDLTMIDARLRALGRPGLIEAGWRGPVLDPLVIERAQRGRGKYPLESVTQTYGVVNAAAHDAAGDAIASTEVLIAQTQEFPRLLATDLDRMTEVQVGWHREWAEGFMSWLNERDPGAFDEADVHWPISGKQLTGT